MNDKMKCCDEEPKFISCYDNPSTDYAYNLFMCDNCGSLFKEDVWKNKGIIKISFNNEVIKCL